MVVFTISPLLLQAEPPRPLPNPMLFAALATVLSMVPGFSCGYVAQVVRGPEKPLPVLTSWVAGLIAIYVGPWKVLPPDQAIWWVLGMGVVFGVSFHLGARYRHRQAAGMGIEEPRV